jgi:hypothetical protein
MSRVRGGRNPKGGVMKLGTFVELSDVLSRANFYLGVMCSFRACRGQKTGFPFEMHMALTTLPYAFSPGGMLKLGTFVDVLDLKNHANFHLLVMNILRPSWASKKCFLLKCI